MVKYATKNHQYGHIGLDVSREADVSRDIRERGKTVDLSPYDKENNIKA